MYEITDPLITPKQAAAERGQALSTFYRDIRLGRVPDPVYVGPRQPRWRQSWIRDGIDKLRGQPVEAQHAPSPAPATRGRAART